jgi:hypothetical protein
MMWKGSADADPAANANAARVPKSAQRLGRSNAISLIELDEREE